MQTLYDVFFTITEMGYVGNTTHNFMELSTVFAVKIFEECKNYFLGRLNFLLKRYHVSIRIASREVASW